MNHINELTYPLVDDYYRPNLLPPPEPIIGIWGQQRRQYLREHRCGFYTGMLLSGTLFDHLTEIDAQAQELLSQLSSRLAVSEGVTEELKIRDQME